MGFRKTRLLAVIATAALALSGCDWPMGEKPNVSVVHVDAATIEAVREMAKPESPTHDKGVAALLDAGYSPTLLAQRNNRYRLHFKVCGDKSHQECGREVNATDTKPIVTLLLSSKPEGSTVNFSGYYH